MRKSKYLGYQAGDWRCTHVGIASVQGRYTRKVDSVTGNKLLSKHPGSRQYYYIFEKSVLDADKMIRLNAVQALNVIKGKLSIDDLVNKRTTIENPEFSQKVSYWFYQV